MLSIRGEMGEITFPRGFLWGTASAAYQIEGAANEDGRGESIWDRFSHAPCRIRNGDTGDVACDFYHRYRDDIALMGALGLGAARISLSWPRILPSGRGEINHKGIDFYNRVIDAMLERGIIPFVTLYHWDLPQSLEDLGGWPNRDLAGYFSEYAAIAAKNFGDRVKHWMAFNEPWNFTVMGYLVGMMAPGRMDRAAAMRATHVVNLAQAMAVRAIRACSSPAAIGSAFSMQPCHPRTASEADGAAAERMHRFNNMWFLEPAMHGCYPDIFISGTLEEWIDPRPGDFELIKEPLDFVGINLYTRMMVEYDQYEPHMGARPAPPEGNPELTELGLEIYPKALSEIISRITHDYGRPPIYVTENGCAFGDGPGADGMIRDHRRIRYLRDHIAEMGRAIRDGADVRGYFAWTFTDNFEWAEGYSQRFGIVHCDFDTQRRTVKESGRWYSRLARSNVLELE